MMQLPRFRSGQLKADIDKAHTQINFFHSLFNLIQYILSCPLANLLAKKLT